MAIFSPFVDQPPMLLGVGSGIASLFDVSVHPVTTARKQIVGHDAVLVGGD